MNLIKKELTSIFCSINSAFFSLAYLLLAGLLLWIFVGNLNLLDSGYANLTAYFQLSPILFIILIPALCMRSFSDEKKDKTYQILQTRPIYILNIYLYKVLASWLFVCLTIASTFIYVVSIHQLGNPVGSLDLQATSISYLSLFAITLIFCFVSIFASFLHKNQFIAFIIGAALCALFFYGGELTSTLFDGSTQYNITRLGINYHYQSMQRGVIALSDVITLLNYVLLILGLFIFIAKEYNSRRIIAITTLFIITNVVHLFMPYSRIDFSEDKRYSLNQYSEKILSEISKSNKNLEVNVYLEGNLNPGFLRLQEALKYTLDDIITYAGNNIKFKFINPQFEDETVEETFSRMNNLGMKGIVLNEKNRDGKISQQIIYPYIQINSNQDTLSINILKNIIGYTAEENINSSIENLEFELIDALRLFEKEPEAVAFIEGHGDFERIHVLDAEDILSKYYFINRGQIGADVNELLQFKAVIVAGTNNSFSEREKYIIDQYIMNGGSVLWLIDGVKFSEQSLFQSGSTPFIKNETNLDDMFFTYGFRIEPSIVEDTQCSEFLILDENNQSTVQTLKFAPILLPSNNNPITRDISPIKSLVISPISIVSSNNTLTKRVLLTSSMHSAVKDAPNSISLGTNEEENKQEFKESFIPTALSIEGKFSSVFINRAIPDSVESTPANQKLEASSSSTRMIVIGSSSIIKNDIAGEGDQTRVLPIGYDRVANRQMGNRDLIVNAVNWLVNGDEWMALKNKSLKIRLLNKSTIYENRTLITSINTILPIVLVLIVIGTVSLARSVKYKK